MANYNENLVNEINALGIFSEQVPDHVLDYYRKSVPETHEPANHELAGHIRKENKFLDVPKYVEDYLCSIPYKRLYFKKQLMSFQVNHNVSAEECPLKLSSNWVNFQKKYEFNPVHNHSGLFSFIIFHKIPYDYEEEAKDWNGKTSVNNVASCLQFLYVDILGHIQTHQIKVDKSFEGKILFFNAKQNHCVYPFYTSDDYRITISGNIKFKTDAKNIKTVTKQKLDYIL